jgi:hypothetical protein
MVWILVFVLNGDLVTSPIVYQQERLCENAVKELLKQKGISQGSCFSLPRTGAATQLD